MDAKSGLSGKPIKEMLEASMQIPAELNSLAPDFEARSSKGVVRLSDFQGRWVALCFHPADFTPVCASEFAALERYHSKFEEEGCQILGVSPDSVHSHRAWIGDIGQKYGVEPSFPMIEDPSMDISRAYGMVTQRTLSTASMRCVFFINPSGYVRAILQYPMEVGRSVAEMLRLLRALITAEDQGVVTPEGWEQGSATLMSADTDLLERYAPTGSEQ